VRLIIERRSSNSQIVLSESFIFGAYKTFSLILWFFSENFVLDETKKSRYFFSSKRATASILFGRFRSPGAMKACELGELSNVPFRHEKVLPARY
jgi:hypothetical protein